MTGLEILFLTAFGIGVLLIDFILVCPINTAKKFITLLTASACASLLYIIFGQIIIAIVVSILLLPIVFGAGAGAGIET